MPGIATRLTSLITSSFENVLMKSPELGTAPSIPEVDASTPAPTPAPLSATVPGPGRSAAAPLTSGPPLATPSFSRPAALVAAGALVTRTDDLRPPAPEVRTY